MNDVTILVATYGETSWISLANRRAIPSARRQLTPIIHRHGATLHEARNACLHAANTEWIIHLDADDELEDGYVETMRAGTADVRAPAVRYVRDRHGQAPRVPTVWGHGHACSGDCLPYGNWIVVGALVRRNLLIEIGGWRDFTWSEDWDLWLRCHLAGATFEAIPQAIYRAHMRTHSRNQQPQAARLEAHRAIARANGVPVP